MSHLKPGTRCVIVGGCPENIGLIVEIISHIGTVYIRPSHTADVCQIRTVSGRFFPQVWDSEGNLLKGSSNECFTDRHKLRPLVDPKDESEIREADVEDVKSQNREPAECSS